mgnify:CR=1 FL=1
MKRQAQCAQPADFQAKLCSSSNVSWCKAGAIIRRQADGRKGWHGLEEDFAIKLQRRAWQSCWYRQLKDWLTSDARILIPDK